MTPMSHASSDFFSGDTETINGPCLFFFLYPESGSDTPNEICNIYLGQRNGRIRRTDDVDVLNSNIWPHDQDGFYICP